MAIKSIGKALFFMPTAFHCSKNMVQYTNVLQPVTIETEMLTRLIERF